MPNRHRLPATAEDQYSQIIGQRHEAMVMTDESPMASNYESLPGYPSRNDKHMRHLDYINPDEPLKTWILTRTEHKIEEHRPDKSI